MVNQSMIGRNASKDGKGERMSDYEIKILTVPEYQAKLEDAETRFTQLDLHRSTDEYFETKEEIAIYEDKIKSLKRRAINIWEKSNIGEYFKECTFENYDETTGFGAYKRMCEKYAYNFDKDTSMGLVLYGSLGVGKTHLVTAIGNYLVYEQGVSCYFAPVATLMRDIQKRFGKKNEDEKNDPERLCKVADLLILDDLGRQKSSEWTEQILFDIIDARYRAKKPVLITTNLNPEGYSFQENVGDAATSRIMNMCDFYGMNGDDYRVTHKMK